MSSRWIQTTVFLASLLLVPSLSFTAAPLHFDDSLYSALHFRCIGPFRGGRSAAVTGVPGEPAKFYFGGTGGGVWKTTDAGTTWINISDGNFGGSIGAVAVSDWDHNIIYVGGGEETLRGNVSHGDGMWRSNDEGKTWKHIGLDDSRHITRIRIHPKDPNLVYVTALGHLYGPNDQRGVYRTKDGGNTWQRILYVNNEVGAVDLAMDPVNPRILYATMWKVKRTPYSFESGGPGSGLWKSTDGGDTWTDITGNEGLPKDTVGIIGVTVSPVNHDRVWAIVESREGGVFRSDDGGKKWTPLSKDRNLLQRAWYYNRIYADPKNMDMVYVVNVRFWRSKDGGKSFEGIGTPHGDHHDLWIAPEDADRMIVADDGGAQVSMNAGATWSSYMNQPTAQFYRVSTDNAFPYHVLGAQQDNSAIRILSRSDDAGIGERDWEATAGFESGWITADPRNPDIVFGDWYDGNIMRYDHKTHQVRIVNVWPDNPTGHGAIGMRYRFQWNAPLLFSRHHEGTLYAAANLLFKTTNEGQTWIPISGDLTRNDTSKLGPSGGPITKDNTSVEYYCTIFAVAESAVDPHVIWTGSDDGLITVTKDDGKSWTNVTPPKSIMPEWIQINSIEAHPKLAGGLYVAATMYKSDDFHPYLYKTTDFGKTWKLITKGIKSDHFTRVIRADPNKDGLLYGGTERGLYISYNDGESWEPFQLNLPVVPITDLAVKNNDLVVATQGRSYWILDDLTTVHQLTPAIARKPFWLFTPRTTYRTQGGHIKDSHTLGENPENGALIRYSFATKPDSASVTMRVLQGDGTIIKSFYGKADKKKEEEQLPIARGMNQFAWNLEYKTPESFEGMVLWGGWTDGAAAVPGPYKARLIVGKDSMTVDFTVEKDPRSSSTPEDLQAQFDFLEQTRKKINETHDAIKTIRKVKKQLSEVTAKLEGKDDKDSVGAAGKKLTERLTVIEEALYQTKSKSAQDPLNYPIRLNNKLSIVGSLASAGDYRPTDADIAVRDTLAARIDVQLAQLKQIMDTDVPKFNALVRDAMIPAVIVKSTSQEGVGNE